MLEIHVVLRKRLVALEVPRRLATPLERATENAALALTLAAAGDRSQLRRAADQLLVAVESVELLWKEQYLSPKLYEWCRDEMSLVHDSIEEWQHTGREPPRKSQPTSKRTRHLFLVN
jgi:hypothetical protein